MVDPRAGHGPGIGGFKPESEIGVALRAGHACYFATFLPQPMPTQTVEDVIQAEARFLEEIIARHPDAEGKPVVVANCQAGWQIMMTAAVRPELFGPIIVAGAPLSYWAGWRGMNPMRYSGGLLGGSWLTALTSDIGNGKFDGAWLVQNFENLNPANTLWSKQYNLYSKVDTEAERYLSFEKWWGGHVFLNGTEIQYIVDKLFVGNRLATAGLVTSDGIRIDLRNIRSPIVVFCPRATTSRRRRRRWAGSQTFIRTTPKCWPMARPSSTPCTRASATWASSCPAAWRARNTRNSHPTST